MRTLFTRAILLALLLIAAPAHALDTAALAKLATGDNEEKVEAVAALVAEGDPRAVAVLEALAAGELQVAGDRVLIVRGGEAVDAATGARVKPLPKDAEDVVANNRLRSAVASALAAHKLGSGDRAARLAAARELAASADDAL